MNKCQSNPPSKGDACLVATDPITQLESLALLHAVKGLGSYCSGGAMPKCRPRCVPCVHINVCNFFGCESRLKKICES